MRMMFDKQKNRQAQEWSYAGRAWDRCRDVDRGDVSGCFCDDVDSPGLRQPAGDRRRGSAYAGSNP